MRIQHNIMAMNAYRNYTNNTSALAKNLEKLSSGYRINRAGDDAAGLAISEKMRAQITALGTAQKNVKDGISLVKTAEGATQEIHDMLNRMVDLATQSANGTYQNEVDREAIQDEFNALKTEINRIADSSNFNGIKLLDGSLGLNGDAFKIEAGNTYAAATDAAAWDTTGKITNVHGGDAVTGVAPSFKVDLSNLGKMSIGTAASAGKGNITLNVGGTDITVDVGASAVTAATINGSAVAAAFDNATASIGGLNFNITNASGVLTFTATKTGSAVTASEVTAFKAAINGDVVLKDGDRTTGFAAANNPTNINHDVLDLVDPVAEEAGGRLGADIDISDLIADGNTLTIDGKKFTFHIGTKATTANTASKTDIYIDTNKFKTDADVKREAARLLSHKETDNFDLEFDQATGNIHIDAKAASTIKKDAMLKGITGTVKGTEEQVASTKLTIDESKLEKGNVITVGDKSFVYKGDGTNAFTSADDLATKLTAAGYNTDTPTTDANGKKVLNIEGKTTNVDGKTIDAEKITAPTVVGKGLTLQIGEDSEDYNQLSVAIQDMHTDALGLTSNVTLANQEGAQKAVDVIKNAINQVSSTRGKLGATQNRLEHTANNLSTMKENIQDAEATIRDTDIAEEMMAYTKNNILVQSAQAMLAQANQIPQGVLQLLG